MIDPRTLAEAWEVARKSAAGLGMVARRVPDAPALVIWNCGEGCTCPLMEGASDLLYLARFPIPCLAIPTERLTPTAAAARHLAARSPKGGLPNA